MMTEKPDVDLAGWSAKTGRGVPHTITGRPDSTDRCYDRHIKAKESGLQGVWFFLPHESFFHVTAGKVMLMLFSNHIVFIS